MPIIEVNDICAPELDVFARLTGAQLMSRLDPEKAIFIAESPNVIKVALDSGCEVLSILTERRLINGEVGKLIERCQNVPVYVAEREVLKSLTGYELTRGALAAMRRPKGKSPEQLCENARRIAVFEGIMDSTNIGALFRSAAAFDIDAVLLTPTCCDPLSRRSLRVSMGTALQIDFARIPGTEKDWEDGGISYLHSLGFKTAAMALREDSVCVDDPSLLKEERLAIILGTEGTGLINSTIEKSDYVVRIPMSHGVDSLNVAAAGAVVFFALSRSRVKK